MEFRSLNAVFGSLDHRSLAFRPGLNIIQAPNEAGKSTLSSFLRVMLYGLSTRERGLLADKNRYMPWSGSPMEGRLDLMSDGEPVTLTRSTVRANAPMGKFSAVRTGTNDPLPALDAANCGEVLLGVPREVYERSAFIRQSGLAIDQDAELERRIAALITTGREDGVSYSEASAALRKQLNARRHNKTGKLPALESELDALARTLREMETLEADRAEAEAGVERAQKALREAQAELTAHDLFEAQESRRRLQELRQALTKNDYHILHELTASLTPEERLDPELLKRTQGELSVLTRQKADWAAAAELRSDAAQALDHFELDYEPPSFDPLLCLLLAFLGVGLSVGGVLLSRAVLWAPGILLTVGALVLLAVGYHRLRGETKRYNGERSLLAREVREADAKLAAAQQAMDATAEAILRVLPIRRIEDAEAFIDRVLTCYAEIEAASQRSKELEIRIHALEEADRDLPEAPAQPVEQPVRSRRESEAARDRAEAQLREAQRALDYADGRLHSIGSREALQSAIEEKQAQHAALSLEYDALALALDTLEQANAALQNRFSPELGKRAAEYFAALTDGKYHAVLLDRAFGVSAEEESSPVARDVQLLSQGAADQLYLAVRLAICDLVLPAEKSVPLVLDDALINFDDTRCAAALELLLAQSAERQILLLTCHAREAQLMQGREGVHVFSL